jgi:signal transduction histidine kinase
VDAATRSYQAIAQAQASDRLKMELLASVSHEFRSPLHIILGYLDLAREGAFGELSTALADAMDKVSWNAGQLLELVEDFLDLAKLETASAKVEQVDLIRLVRTLVTDNELLVQGRALTVRAEVRGPVPRVRAEAAKLRVIVQNLLTNALKFTERGEVVVVLEPPLPGVVQVHVRDTGPGIPSDAYERIFDLFSSSSPATCERRASASAWRSRAGSPAAWAAISR